MGFNKVGGVSERIGIDDKITMPMILSSDYHQPVLLSRVIGALNILPDRKYIDATLGGGGYTVEIIKKGGRVLGIDLDQDALENFQNNVLEKLNAEEKERVKVVNGNFRDIDILAGGAGFEAIDGVVFDLGMSTNQLEKSGRGFTYQGEEDLDMRMDKNSEIRASDLLKNLNREDLYEVFSKYSEELNSRAIVEAVIRARALKNINKAGELVEIIRSTIVKGNKIKDMNTLNRNIQRSAARIFQALRIVVNNELDNLTVALAKVNDLLLPNGRIAVLSYHSLEDREVKLAFKKMEKKGNFRILTKSPYRASYMEIKNNPKSRSAKLRIGEKYI